MGLLNLMKPNRGKLSSKQRSMQWDAPTNYLTGSGRHYDRLRSNDRVVKIWIPDAVRTAFRELADYYDSDLSSVVRHVLFVHAYGHYDLLVLAERGDRRFMPQGTGESFMDRPMYSRRATADSRTADLGKNDHDLKVWAPGALVDEIDRLAKIAGISRSEYIREILVSHLFGRTQLPDRR